MVSFWKDRRKMTRLVHNPMNITLVHNLKRVHASFDLFFFKKSGKNKYRAYTKRRERERERERREREERRERREKRRETGSLPCCIDYLSMHQDMLSVFLQFGDHVISMSTGRVPDLCDKIGISKA